MAAEINTFISKNGFQWIDVVNPRRSDVEQIAKKNNFHSTSVQDCLDPEHLPKFEKLSNYNFIILRAYDEKVPAEADTVEELSRKIAIFYTPQLLITIHRRDLPFLARLREKWKSELESNDVPSLMPLLVDIIKTSMLTFETPIDKGLDQLEQFEMGIFNAHGAKTFHLEDGYYLKRKAFVFKRILRVSGDAIQKIGASGEPQYTPLFQDLRDTLENMFFYADELFEGVNGLLNLHISLQQQKTNEASHRTNEVVRILTIFSVFFMPLNFIASIYGMNFKFMPELDFVYGYPATLTFMVVAALAIYLFFRRKGWL